MAASDTLLPLSVEEASFELRRFALLKRIADQLGTPIAGIGQATRSSDSLTEDAELFGLWQALVEPSSRRRLLVLARELAAAEEFSRRSAR